MLAIVILLLLTAFAALVAIVAASPLFRTISVAVDSWADGIQGVEPIN